MLNRLGEPLQNSTNLEISELFQNPLESVVETGEPQSTVGQVLSFQIPDTAAVGAATALQGAETTQETAVEEAAETEAIDHEELIRNLMTSIPNINYQQAETYLQQNGWSIEGAVNAFMDQVRTQRELEEAREAREEVGSAGVEDTGNDTQTQQSSEPERENPIAV